MKSILDIQTGKTYESEDAAKKAGVATSDIAITFTSGPGKGRIYRRNSLGQLERMDMRRRPAPKADA